MGKTEAELSKPRIVSFVPSVLQTLANRIANHTIDRPAVRELLRKDFSVSVVSGVGALGTSMTAAEPLLEEFARGWVVTSTSDLTLGRPFPYSYTVDKAALQHDFPLGVGRFTYDSSSLLVVTTAGVRTPTATYVVHGAYTPTLPLLPSALDDDALNVGVELISTGVPQPPEPASAIE